MVALALASMTDPAGAIADVSARPHAMPGEIAAAKRVLAANGYSEIAVLSSDDQLVTLSAKKDGARSVLDVDPLTGIMLAHADLPPLPPVTGTGNPR
jgi:hypothetical protein